MSCKLEKIFYQYACDKLPGIKKEGLAVFNKILDVAEKTGCLTPVEKYSPTIEKRVVR